jgi:aminopeptidase N
VKTFPRLARSAALVAAVLVAACSPAKYDEQPKQEAAAGTARAVAPVLTTPDAKDIHSFARPEVARVTHVALDLAADFAAKRLAGTATLDVQAAPGAEEIVLDSKGLEIAAVTNGEGQKLQYTVGQADPNLGAPLTVRLNGAQQVRISYKSAPEAAALQWLDPEQTAGKKHPFLFSQGQAILNRTWIPTQDSPGIRQTWEARIVVPAPLRAVMSGEDLTPKGEEAKGGRAYRYRMNQPVAPYLIALAAGDLAFRELGACSGVYAEPATIAAAAREFSDTERMITAAEELYGPYRWGRYDMIVLPPSFPFGGMENPRLTFLTPTLLAGDKSLVATVAHELAHSWSGNLVTNATWADFWLNEGFTTYFQSRIMEKLYGKEATDREIALGWDELQETMNDQGGPASPRTVLHLDLKGVDPDEGMTEIAYEKGAAFLRTLEQAVGRERWDAYLRSYFDRHAFQPMTAQLFLADLRDKLLRGDTAVGQQLRLEDWIYKPGIPANVAAAPAQAFAEVDGASRAYAAGGLISEVSFAGWSTSERLRFLNDLPRKLPKERLAELDRNFRLSDSTNSELLFAWLRLAIENRYDPAVPALDRFLTSMGRRKFVAPLFEALAAQGEWGRPIATRIYAKARPTYHAVTSGTVDKALATS